MSKKLITDLGGAQRVAEFLSVSVGSVRNWMLPGRSIAWKYRPAVARLAADLGVSLPDDFWAVAA